MSTENKCPNCGNTLIGSNQGNTLMCLECGYHIGLPPQEPLKEGTPKPKEGDKPQPNNFDTITT